MYFPGELGFAVLQGVLAKWAVERGFLMVNLWWIRGESWLIDGPISGLKNMSRIADFIFGFRVWDSSNCIDAFGKWA